MLSFKLKELDHCFCCIFFSLRAVMLQVAAFCIAMKTHISITPQHDMKPIKRFYVCDRTRCEHCSYECRHTTDLKHALYPDYDSWEYRSTKDGASMWQVPKKYPAPPLDTTADGSSRKIPGPPQKYPTPSPGQDSLGAGA